MTTLGHWGKEEKFNFFMRRVDDELYRRCGLMSADLPDIDYWDEFDSGSSPVRTARIAIREATGY